MNTIAKLAIPFAFLVIVCLTVTVHRATAQCPNAGNIGTGTHSFAIACGTVTVGPDLVLTDADITIQNGGSLTITITAGGSGQPDAFVVNGGGIITVESGGQLTVNGTFAAAALGTINIESGGVVIVNGDFYIGNPLASGPGEEGDVTVDGTLTVNGTMILDDDGTIDGTGSLNADNITNNGGDDSGFTGPVSCTGTCDSLPVELLSFSADQFNSSCELTWSTGTEINNEGFYIEKSLDNIDYSPLDFIVGSGTTNEAQHYTFTDNYFTQSAYYRLRQVDFDGAFEIHSAIFVKSHSASDVALKNNPVTDKFVLQGSNDLQYSASLLTISGRPLANFSDQSLARIQTELNAMVGRLSPAIYLLHLNSAEGLQTIRFIKK